MVDETQLRLHGVTCRRSREGHSCRIPTVALLMFVSQKVSAHKQKKKIHLSEMRF